MKYALAILCMLSLGAILLVPGLAVDTTVVIQDGDDQAVSGALVWVTTVQPDGSPVSYSGTTGDGGSVTFTLRTRQSGLYTSTVTGVQKAGWSYDAGANIETANSLAVP